MTVKRRHVTTGLSAAALVGLATAALQAWNAVQASRERDREQAKYEFAVKACEDMGWMWWRGDCIPPPRDVARQPK